MTLYDYFSVFYLILAQFSLLSSYGKSFWSFVYDIIYCVGAGISTLISNSDWSDSYIFRQKMEETRSVKEKMEGNVFFSRQSRHISFVIFMIKVLFSTLYFTWRVNNYVSRQGKGINRRNESTREILNITLIISWLYWLRLVVYFKELHFCFNLKFINKYKIIQFF